MTICKFDLSDKMKRRFFQAVAVSILLYGCTTWTLMINLEEKLDGNHTRILHAVLNKSFKPHHTKKQLYSHLLPISQTIHLRWAKHTGHWWRSKYIYLCRQIGRIWHKVFLIVVAKGGERSGMVLAFAKTPSTYARWPYWS